MKTKKIIIYLLIFLFLFIISIVFSLFNMINENIIRGISINNIDISNLSKDEIRFKFSEILSKKAKAEIKLEYTSEEKETYEKNIDLSILNIEYDLDNCLLNAYNLGRTGNIFKNNFDIISTFLLKKNFDFKITYDEKMLDTILTDISANLPGKVVNSSYYIEDKKLVITKGTSGITVDREKVKNELLILLENIISEEKVIQIPVENVDADAIDIDKIHSEIFKEPKDAYFEKEPFKVYSEVQGIDFDIEKAKEIISKNPESKEYTINLKYTDPKVKLKDLKLDVFKDLLGTFSTKYNESNEDRTTNLHIAADKIDGTIIGPGEEFSYNQIVGERSISQGYKEAKVYQGGQIVDGLGGGICQISSTLYNAVVFANLKVTQRFNHQFLTSYVSAGRDATVAYGSKDFKFVNSRTYPIKINVSIFSGIAKVDIYGIKEDKEYQIDFDVETISNIPYKTREKFDSSLPSGTQKIEQRGADGIVVKTYKVIKENDKEVSRELLSRDTYNSLDKVVVKSKN